MFTGIITHQGTVTAKPAANQPGKITVQVPGDFINNLRFGDSIAVDGICLTVIDFADDYLIVDISPETVDKTTFNNLPAEHQVNLEKSLKLGDSIDGHLVSGHVDTVATVTNIIDLDDNKVLIFSIQQSYLKYIAIKGSVCINGVSLTINKVDSVQSSFAVNIIPHTLEKTNLNNLQIGSRVNIEIDMMARYSANYLENSDAQNLDAQDVVDSVIVLKHQNYFNTTEEILEDFAVGKMVIMVDNEDRENEGDLIIAAEKITAEQVNFMCKHARGLICLVLSEQRCAQLDLPLMIESKDNKTPFKTRFTVSVEAATGVTTGISSADRARTMQVCANPHAKPTDVVKPGHVFPLMAQPGGVLTRAGHTEACADLAMLTGLQPAVALVEILNDNGTMARRDDLMLFAKRHGLKIGTIADLIQYRLKQDALNQAADFAGELSKC